MRGRVTARQRLLEATRGAYRGTALRLVWAGLLLGCNLGGYPNLGSEVDNLEFVGSENATAWIRTQESGESQILVLGTADPGAAAGCVLVTMGVDSTGTILAGEYTVSGSRIVLSIRSEYAKTAEFDLPPSGRDGTTRTDYDPPREIQYEVEETEGRLLLTETGESTLVMTPFWDMVSAIDPTTQKGMELLSRVYNLTTVGFQMRVPGFGGAGLLQYTDPSRFVGILGGSATIELSTPMNPLAVIVFYDFKDYPGVTLSGDQISQTSMAGDGAMTGTMHFDISDPREGGTFSVEGDLFYDLQLTNGRSSGGGYTIELTDGAVWEVSYDEAENLDFRSVLPPS